ncbi:hypothetical protein CYMTET_27590, partial [Cymbomonas tetramitiformis]
EGAARALLEAGAGVNAGTGRRPLHAAAERATVDMVRELFDMGAKVDAEDQDGFCALDVFLSALVRTAMLAVLRGPAAGKLDGTALVFPSGFQTFGCTFACKAPSRRVYYELVILESLDAPQFGFVDASFELSASGGGESMCTGARRTRPRRRAVVQVNGIRSGEADIPV